MNRPYVICYTLSSLDGKINGPFMATNAVKQYANAITLRYLLVNQKKLLSVLIMIYNIFIKKWRRRQI